jgi:hypothetical protein
MAVNSFHASASQIISSSFHHSSLVFRACYAFLGLDFIFLFGSAECFVDPASFVILQEVGHVYYLLYKFLSWGWKMAAVDERPAKKQVIGIN